MLFVEEGCVTPKGDEMEDKVVISTKEVARLLDVSVRHVSGMDKKGLLPRPVRLGTSVRFVRVEIGAWIRSGCPSRERWEEMKAHNLNIDDAALGLVNCLQNNIEVANDERDARDMEEFMKKDYKHFNKLSQETDPLEGATEIPQLSVKRIKANIPTKRSKRS